jgi:hemerythrin-like domain-containing protein
MTDCHRRIERFLSVLERVAQRGHRTALSDKHRRYIERALRYFDSAVLQHTEDERALFQLIRESNQGEGQNTWQQLTDVEAEHARRKALHRELESQFRRWINLTRMEPPQRHRLIIVLRCLREMYQRHIETEERKVFPLAGTVLSSDQLDQLGQEMAERRGLGDVLA